MAEHSRKSLKSFYCKENLWSNFETMAREANVSVDSLLDDAMNQFLRRKDEGTPADHSPARQGRFPQAPPSTTPAPSMGHPGGSFDQPAPAQVGPVAPPPPLPQAGGPSFGKPQFAGGGRRAPHIQAPAPHAPVPPGPAMHPGMGRGQHMGGPWAGPRLTPPLYVYYNGKSHLIDKEQFVIGRSARSADLTIKDGNISRRHCVVNYSGGQYFIKDLGSTNGIEFRGNRIESKHIDEGDMFTLCGHQIIFTYQG